jgi:hypothetical protein
MSVTSPRIRPALLVILALCAALLITSAPPAAANSHQVCSTLPSGLVVCHKVGGGGNGNPGTSNPSNPSNPSRPPTPWYGGGYTPGDGWAVVTTVSNTDPSYPCITMRQPGSMSLGAAQSAVANSPLPPCPGGETPAQAVRRLFEEQYRAQLPAPSPRVEPDSSGVTGLEVFLEIDDVEPPPFPSGGFGVTVARTLEVHWGDDDDWEPAPSPGGPYPDGDLTHVYEEAGVHTITVRTTWSVSWDGGDLPEVSLEGTVDVTIREVQAIRRR